MDALSLQQALNTSRETLSALEEVVITVQDAIEKLKALRPSLEESISNLRTVLHPIRSIPDEMLSEVFGWCMPRAYDSTLKSFASLQGDSLAPGSPPWTLSQVSRRWRAITLSHPRLWSVVDLPFLSYRMIPHMKIIYRLLLQLKRSSPCCLSVRLRRAHGDFDDILHTLQTETDRWEALTTFLSPEDLQSFSGCNFSRLQYLTLKFELGDSHGVIDTFQYAHSLACVKRKSGREINVVFPTHQLKSYRTRGHGADLLPRLTSLQTLKMHCSPYDLARNPSLSLISPSSPLMLSSLEDITLVDYSRSARDIGSTRYLSARINAPGLVRLRVHYRGVLVQAPVLYHPGVLTHLHIHLEDYGQSTVKSDAMLSFLRSTRNVEVFSLVQFVETAGFELVEALRVNVSASSVLLPMLRSLILNMDTLLCKCQEVVDMAGHRRMRHLNKGDVAQCTIWIPRGDRELYANGWEIFKIRADSMSLMALEASVESTPLFGIE